MLTISVKYVKIKAVIYMSNFYDGTKLLSMKDINGKTPEIFICTSNRTAGKTTYFSRLLVNRFLKKGKKFCLIYRYSYELDNCHEKFFKDIHNLFFKNYEMTAEKVGRVFNSLFINDEHCGYAVALNSSDSIKKYSHMFSDVESLFMDEFQSETNHYCSKEIEKFISVHTSMARGNGKQIRYLPVFMCGNPVSILNPYYVQLGISDRLKDNTKFLRGDGFVLEQGFNQSASSAMISSGFNRAFSNNKYVAYSSQGVYLRNNNAFIDSPKGFNNYIATLRYEGIDYSIREYPQLNLLYCGTSVDHSFSPKIAVTTEDHQINYVMLKSYIYIIDTLRYYFDEGLFRFKNQSCKEAVLKALAYY